MRQSLLALAMAARAPGGGVGQHPGVRGALRRFEETLSTGHGGVVHSAGEGDGFGADPMKHD